MFKKIIIGVIAVLIVGGVVAGFAPHKSSNGKTGDAAVEVTHSIADDQIAVYYFHSTGRCYTCNKMEEYTKAAVADNFKTDGRIVFRAINTDDAANRHFLTDYSLYTKSVVLVNANGDWKNLDQIWNLVRDEGAFKSYIISEINEFAGDVK